MGIANYECSKDVIAAELPPLGRGAAGLSAMAGRGLAAILRIFDNQRGEQDSPLNPYLPFPWEGIALGRCF